MDRPSVLVTGSHRSGSSWLGKMICQSPGAVYISEPFNPSFRPHTPISCWFEHVYEGSPQSTAMSDYMHSFSKFDGKDLAADLAAISKSSSYFKIFVKDYLAKLQLGRNSVARAVFKDPIAIFSAEWIAQNLGSSIIVVIRHPAAFVASLKVKSWFFDFSHLGRQQQLVDTLLSDYKAEITAFSQDPPDIIDQGILLWNIFHKTILSYREKYGNQWYFVRHEDLSVDPLTEFGGVYQFLGLTFDQGITSKILEHSSAGSSGIKRDSAANVKSWKKRLSENEIVRIKEGTGFVASSFYDKDSDW